MSEKTVLLVGEKAPELATALQADSTFRFLTYLHWEAVDHQAKADFVVAESCAPVDHGFGSLPSVIMRPAFAWDGEEFLQDPPGWEFTKRAMLDRIERHFAGRPPLKMMIVDDESGIRTAMKAMLSRFGLDVAAESEREQSLENLARGTFELLLTDVNMPGMCWKEYVERVRQLSPQTQIYLATGDREVAVVEGVQGILHKPFGLAEVARLALPLLACTPV